MSSFPGSPKLVRGGLIALDASSGTVLRVLTLQYNPDSVSRTLQVQAHGDGAGELSEALRLKGPAVETIKLDAEMDAADYLEQPDQHANVVRYGLHPQIAAFESLLNPTSAYLTETDAQAGSGTLEIIPAQAPLTLFVWGGNRTQPVRISEFSVTEEAFDAALNPIRVKLSLGLRVLSVADVGFGNRAGGLYMSYLRSREAMAQRLPPGSFASLGISGI